MTEDRQMVMMAVLEGKLDSSHVTWEEIEELQDAVFEAIAEKKSPFQTFEVLQ